MMGGGSLSGAVPLVSVVIPAYEADAFLARAIDSAMAQSYANKEIIVVDDGSTDGARAVVGQFEQGVRYIRQKHAGQATATNRGIRQSTGKFIALLDADDEWLPERLERTVSPLIRNERIGLSYCLATIRYPDGREEARLPRRLVRQRPGAVYWPRRVCVPAVTFRRSVFERVGGFDEAMPHYNDHDFFLRVAEVSRIHEVPEFLVRVHARPDSQQHNYPVEVVVETYLRVFYKALGRGRKEYDLDVALSVAYANAAVMLWLGRRRSQALRYAMTSCFLRPHLGETVGILKAFSPRWVVRLNSAVNGLLRTRKD